ncbi:1108_t:CDS:2, partial [Dentiscutata heterogama]
TMNSNEKRDFWIRLCLAIPILILAFLCPCLLLYATYSSDQIPGSKNLKIVQVFRQIYIANIICMWLFGAFTFSWRIKDCVNPDFTNREFYGEERP